MATAPPAADTKKPATPSPAKVPEKAADKAPQKSAEKAPAPAAAKAGGQAPATGQQRFDRLAVRPKLAVSEPGDAVEREADAVADRVMRAPAPDTGKSGKPAPAKPAQANKEVQRKPSANADVNAPTTSTDLLTRLGAGAPLDTEARAFFEQRLGRDLADVQVHSDAAAADAARSLQARAFTWGRHIAFASGEYQPASERGRQLLAHELAHVMQNDGASLSHVVARKPGDNPKFKEPNNIDKDAFDPTKDKETRPGLETLKLPAIKARHADYYKKLAGKSLKRPAGYDRKTNAFKTDQVKKWKEAVDLSAFYTGIGFTAGAGAQSLSFYGAKNQTLKGTEGELIEQIKVPKWTPDGSWLGSPLQVDHIVEVQVGGFDMFENYELLTGAHNTNVGSLLRASIYANVKGFLAANDKNTGDVLVKQYLDQNDVEFKQVEGGGEGKNLEKGAQFWSRQEITAGKHLAWLKDEGQPKNDGTDKSHFALYSYTGNGFIDSFPLSKNKVSLIDSGRLAGIKLSALTLNADFDSAAGGAPIGLLKGAWDLPSQIKASEGKTFESPLLSVAGKKYAGALSSLPPPKLDMQGASPVTFGEIGFARGKLSADGTLTTTHPLFAGVEIPVRWRGDDFAFEYTFPVDQLAGKLPIPGVTIDEASVTLFFGSKGLGADGQISFTIAGFGAGQLSVVIKQGANGPELSAKGSLTADRKLFDLATIAIGYSSAEGFFGQGQLGITQPDKIKGIKSARLSAAYAKSVFTATGEVVPDIPGLKAASLSVSYAKDSLQITGKLGVDEKVPGVESADITVELKQGGTAGWKVAAAGEVVPKLPGLSGAKLAFSYDEGSVLIEGEFALKKGPLDGKVKAGVTNAAVDEQGQRADKGEGRSFKVFGAADIKAEFIKDKLDGNLKLRLLPDGSVRVGGGLAVKDFEVFGKTPKDGGEFLNKTFSTPSVPIPGLGFSVGSLTVGVTFSASLTAKAHANIGPGKLTGITIAVAEFDPAHIDFNALEIGGGANFQVFADAGFGVSAQINLEFGAAVAKLVGSVGAEATAGLPTDKPVLSAASVFSYSAAKGLDISNTLNLAINPELKFRLFGRVAAELNLLIDTITVWSKDWTLAEANYKLPVSINASGALGYNSKTGQLRPASPSEAIKVEPPKLDADAMKGVVSGDSAPATVKTTDRSGQPAAGPAVNPQRETGAVPGPLSVDESVVERLGSGEPLDLATRGFFEQRLRSNLAEVRIYRGPGAAREADRLSARAFTVGPHIAFACGQYQPDTPDGRELLAHELAHVLQQQGGAARRVMREITATSTTAPPATPAAAGRGPITLPSLRLPELKYSSDALNSHRKAAYDGALPTLERPAGYRRAEVDSRQRTLWTQATPAASLRTALATKVPGLEPEKVYVAVPRSLPLASAGNQVVIGRPTELALALRQPRWDRQGQADEHPFEIDHIIELQVGGPAQDRIANLELLERSANGASGRGIDGFMDQAFAAYAASPAAASLPEADRNAEVLKRQYRVRFGGFVAQGTPAAGKRWTLAEVLAGEPAEGLHLYDPAGLPGAASAGILQPWPTGVDAARFTGSPNLLVVYASARGGEPRQVPLLNGQAQDPAAALRNLLPGITTHDMTLNLSGAADGPIGRVRGALTHAQLAPEARVDIDIPITRRRGLANAGVLNTEATVQRLRSLLREGGVTALSPVVVDEVDVLPGIGLYVAGHVEPTIALIRHARLDFQIRGSELIVSKTFSGGEMNLGGPFRIDSSDLTVGLSTRQGLLISGGVAFGIERLGQGTLRGAGRSGEFAIDGRFDFDRRLFDADANIALSYRRGADAPEGKLSGAGTVTIGPGKVRGIRRATVQAAFDGDQHSLAGTAELDIPGVESATLGVQFTPEGGTEISGSARFRNRPGLRNGQISAHLVEAAEGWSLSASGSAEASFAGISANLTASYDNGLFLFAADAPFAVGERVSGRVRVGLTNGNVDDQGRLVEGSAPAGGAELRPFGNGTVDVRLTDWLQGSVGLRVRPDGELRISGAIGIPAPVTVFEQFPSPERAQRSLFTMPTVSVPLVGLSVGSTVIGLALTINGRVTGHAHVGPGQLRQTQLRIEDFNPAQPDSLHVTGDAQFHLPAEAGVAASLDAGVSLGAAIVSATAGLSVSASASLTAAVTPQVALDWRAATGLHLHADLNASLTPRLAFDLNGYAEVTANAFVTTFSLWRKDWNLAHREIGSSLALRMNAPVDFYSDGRGVVFDPAQVSFEVPSLSADTLTQLLNGEGSERAEAPRR